VIDKEVVLPRDTLAGDRIEGLEVDIVTGGGDSDRAYVDPRGDAGDGVGYPVIEIEVPGAGTVAGGELGGGGEVDEPAVAAHAGKGGAFVGVGVAVGGVAGTGGGDIDALAVAAQVEVDRAGAAGGRVGALEDDGAAVGGDAVLLEAGSGDGDDVVGEDRAAGEDVAVLVVAEEDDLAVVGAVEALALGVGVLGQQGRLTGLALQEGPGGVVGDADDVDRRGLRT
jgi:hypothetical protein